MQTLRKKKKENQVKMKKTGSTPQFITVLFLVLFAGWQALAKTEVNATLDRDQSSIGDAVTVNVVVNSDEDFEPAMPQLPHVPGLEEINSGMGAHESSSNMSIINGTAQYSKSIVQVYQFLLSPQKEGKFSIPIIDVNVNGKTYKTQPLHLDVSEAYRNGHAKAKKPAKDQRKFPPGFGGGDEDETSPFGSGQNAEDLFDQLLQQQQRLFGQRMQGGGGIGGNGRGRRQAD